MSLDRTELCDEVQALLATGEAVRSRRLRAHRRSCSGCRSAEALLAPILESLAAPRAVTPPELLDRRIRSLLLGPVSVQRCWLRPGMALGLAVASLLAMVATLSAWFAQAGAAELGPVVAVSAVVIYLAVCVAATIPLFVPRRAGEGPVRTREVRP